MNNDWLRFNINEEMLSIRSITLFEKRRIQIPLAFDPQFESFSRAVKNHINFKIICTFMTMNNKQEIFLTRTELT